MSHGESYLTRDDYHPPPLVELMSITVEYRPDHPAISRIQGLRSRLYSSSAMFLIGFALIAVGLALLLPRLFNGATAIGLLIAGQTAQGEVTRIDDDPVSTRVQYLVTITYVVDGLPHTLTVRTAEVKPAWATEAARFGATATGEPSVLEDVLYAPRCPELATALAGIDLNLRLDERGVLHGLRDRLSFLLILLPIAGIMACNCLLHYLMAG